MYNLKFTLQQHTPLIHFQHHQNGATLRATELKPKLDKFLIEKLELTETVQKKGKAVEQPKKEYAQWFNNQERLSLDYKVRITSNINESWNITPEVKYFNRSKNQEMIKKDNFPTFFATMGKEWENNPKYFIYTEEDTTVILFSFHQILLNRIKTLFGEFLFVNNFGTRQSKGFGSFYLSPNDENYKNPIALLNENTSIKFYHFSTNFSSWRFKFLGDSSYVNYSEVPSEFKIQKKLFTVIELFYKTLRSGINQQGFYFKSLLFLYAKEKLKISWDKKLIKNKFLKKEQFESQIEKHSNGNHKCDTDPLTYDNNGKFIRDILGLATDQKYGRDFKVRHPVKEDKKKGYNLNDVERFKSPILFKPIKIKNEFEVFIIPQKIHHDIFNESITVLKTIGEKKDEKIVDSFTGKTVKEFDLNAYLKFAFTENDFDKYAEKCASKDHDFFKVLSSLYSQLKNN